MVGRFAADDIKDWLEADDGGRLNTPRPREMKKAANPSALSNKATHPRSPVRFPQPPLHWPCSSAPISLNTAPSVLPKAQEGSCMPRVCVCVCVCVYVCAYACVCVCASYPSGRTSGRSCRRSPYRKAAHAQAVRCRAQAPFQGRQAPMQT